MAELNLQVTKLESGRVKVTVMDHEHPNLDGSPHKLWELEVSAEYTHEALRQALKATSAYLTCFLSFGMKD